MGVVCDVYKSCVIFNDEVAGMKLTSQLMRSRYCTDNYSRCICYKHSSEQILISGIPLVVDRMDSKQALT